MTQHKTREQKDLRNKRAREKRADKRNKVAQAESQALKELNALRISIGRQPITTEQYRAALAAAHNDN